MGYGKTILDTRDLDKRLDELKDLKTALETAREELEELQTEENQDETDKRIADAEKKVRDAEDEFGEEEAAELKELTELESEVSGWFDGETLIPRSEWVEYVKDLLADCGDLPKDLPHYIVIDWDTTADNIEADYSEVTYQGETYLVRNC